MSQTHNCFRDRHSIVQVQGLATEKRKAGQLRQKVFKGVLARSGNGGGFAEAGWADLDSDEEAVAETEHRLKGFRFCITDEARRWERGEGTLERGTLQSQEAKQSHNRVRADFLIVFQSVSRS